LGSSARSRTSMKASRGSTAPPSPSASPRLTLALGRAASAGADRVLASRGPLASPIRSSPLSPRGQNHSSGRSGSGRSGSALASPSGVESSTFSGGAANGGRIETSAAALVQIPLSGQKPRPDTQPSPDSVDLELDVPTPSSRVAARLAVRAAFKLGTEELPLPPTLVQPS
jgi:hypothetical protein